MPEITGLELLHRLKRNGVDIPSIVITAHNEPGLRKRCQCAGVAFLIKPFDGNALISAINSAVRRSSRMEVNP
jgi:FixJ family two-component response regulator